MRIRRIFKEDTRVRMLHGNVEYINSLDWTSVWDLLVAELSISELNFLTTFDYLEFEI